MGRWENGRMGGWEEGEEIGKKVTVERHRVIGSFKPIYFC